MHKSSLSQTRHQIFSLQFLQASYLELIKSAQKALYPKNFNFLSKYSQRMVMKKDF